MRTFAWVTAWTGIGFYLALIVSYTWTAAQAHGRRIA